MITYSKETLKLLAEQRPNDPDGTLPLQSVIKRLAESHLELYRMYEALVDGTPPKFKPRQVITHKPHIAYSGFYQINNALFDFTRKEWQYGISAGGFVWESEIRALTDLEVHGT